MSFARVSYLATFRVNGETWPFSGTAVSLSETVEVDRRRLVTGETFRAVVVPPPAFAPGGVRRANKESQVRVSFDEIDYEWLKRLQNLKDRNQPFGIQMIAFDSRSSDGVPMYSTTPVLTSVESPKNLAAAGAGGGTLSAAGGFGYLVTAVANGAETVPGPEVLATPGGGNGSVALSWGHVSGVTSYRVYGRTPGLEVFMAERTPSALGGGSDSPASGTALAFTDDGSITPSPSHYADPSLYTLYAVANERRWSDDPSTIQVVVNGVVRNLDVIDHNGVVTTVGSPYGVIDTRTGTVTMFGPQGPNVPVWAQYVWEPKVAIDEIDPSPHPTAVRPPPIPTYDGFGAVSGLTYADVPGVLYSPRLTLSILM